jgi:hypothetical protein
MYYLKRNFIRSLLVLAYSLTAFTLYAQTLYFSGSELLGRPTDQSVTVNVEANKAIEAYFEYGSAPGVYTNQTAKISAAAFEPIEVVMTDLNADTQYYYRMVYRAAGDALWLYRSPHTFRTQRAPGAGFTFTITADSHLGQYGGQTADEKALYQRTLLNVRDDQPDFHIDLGDTFAMDPSPLGTGMTESEAAAAYLIQRPYMGLISGSVPIFLVLGNHENEEGWNFDDVFTLPDQSLARVGLKYRKLLYPNPVPDGFYSGNTDPLPQAIGGDTNREDYYAWEWGDALFVIIDPFQYSMVWPAEGGSYGGEGMDGEPRGDRWDWTLGIKQYLWFKNTLENSKARYKFVFSHQVTGGATTYGRGGVSAAPYFEWGGRNADGAWGWDTKRPASEGWDVPIHQLMVANKVSVFFHGHDHIYARELLDGILYLEVPKPDDAGYDWQPYGYGNFEGLYPNALQIQNSGHIRVNVSPAGVTADYVRSYLPGDGTNGVVADTVALSRVTISTDPSMLSFEVDGVPYTTSQSFSWVAGSGHTIATTASQRSESAAYVFAGWSDGGAISHTITTPANATMYTASFSVRYRLTISPSPVSGGRISADPASADGFYDSGTSVQLTATPNPGFYFCSWTGDLRGSTNSQVVAMSMPRGVTAVFSPPAVSSVNVHMNGGGAAMVSTAGCNASTQAGYAAIAMNSGASPYATAVFNLRQKGVTVTEAGVPASPPTNQARIFIDWRSSAHAVPANVNGGLISVNTGIAVVNTRSASASVTYILRDSAGKVLSLGHGTIAAGRHIACFIDELKVRAEAQDFSLPADFPTATQFGSLEIASSQPLSVLGLRGTTNQDDEFLMTTTPIADLTHPLDRNPIYFPQFVDGGGYTTSIILLNTSSVSETGTLEITDGKGKPFVVSEAGGTTGSRFAYSIPPGGVYRFQTDGSPASVKAGWVRLIPDEGTWAPVGSGVFGYNPEQLLISESGIPSAAPTTRARVYVDLSRSHNTGLALANLVNSAARLRMKAYSVNGIEPLGEAPIPLEPNGYAASFADEFIKPLPAEFTGVLEISSETPFAALTLRTLINERDDFLMATFPVADLESEAPSPIVFPQVVDGGGYETEFILINPSGASTATLDIRGETGEPLPVGDRVP